MTPISQVDVTGKKILVRMDLDVPVGNGKVVDDLRLRAGLPTLRFLIDNGAAGITIIGHRGRPEGKEKQLSLKPVVMALISLVGCHPKEPSEIGSEIFRCAQNDTTISFPKNLRFDPGETGNVPGFARQLANDHDLYVNEAFAVSHRAHASIIGIPKILPSYAGIRFAREVKVLTQVRENPARPLIFIIGGGKNDKVEYVKAFSEYADKILLGGVLMFEQSLEGVPKVRFPVDAVEHFDIGPRSISLFKQQLVGAKAVVWNGPLGKFEEEEYAAGTREIAETLAHLAQEQGVEVIIGGGDTLAALKKFQLRDKISFISTGGGAMLEFLAKGTLPALKALEISSTKFQIPNGEK